MKHLIKYLVVIVAFQASTHCMFNASKQASRLFARYSSQSSTGVTEDLGSYSEGALAFLGVFGTAYGLVSYVDSHSPKRPTRKPTAEAIVPIAVTAGITIFLLKRMPLKTARGCAATAMAVYAANEIRQPYIVPVLRACADRVKEIN